MDPYLVVWADRNKCRGAPVDDDRGVCTMLDPSWDRIRLTIQDILVYAKKIDLKATTPQGQLSTSGFCLANPGSQYLVFGTSNAFTLTTVAGTYKFEWFNPTTHATGQTGMISVGSS